MEELGHLKKWLIAPLSDEESNLVSRGKKYWAGCSLAQNLATKPEQELELMKDICKGPIEDGLLDVRGLIFLLFSSSSSNPYAPNQKGKGLYYLIDELQSREFNAIDIFQLLKSKPIAHISGNELSKIFKTLADRLSIDSSDIPPALFRSLYVVILELQEERQRSHAIWQCWSEIFKVLCRRAGYAEMLAYISYLLVQTIFTQDELSNVKMYPKNMAEGMR